MVTLYDNDIEQAVIGAILCERDAVALVAVLLKPKHFYSDINAKLYALLLNMHAKGMVIDVLTVAEAAKKADMLEYIGGAVAIASMSSRVHSAVHIEHHARIIIDLYMHRRVLALAERIKAAVHTAEVDISEIIDKTVSELVNMSNIGTNETRPIGLISEPLADRISKRQNKEFKPLEGMVYTKYDALDNLIGYFEPGDMVIIAARPSMGKTAFAQNLCKNLAQGGQGIAFFSLEMSADQITNRFIIEQSGVPSDKIKSGNLTDIQMHNIFNAEEYHVRTLPVYIDDTAGLSIPQLRAKLMVLKSRYQITAFVFDYIQLGASGENYKQREAEVAAISRGIKKIAKDLGLVAFALSQLNRAIETRTGNKQPQLSDLRESGGIEQDADCVIFLHRPEKYGVTEYDDGTSTANIAEVIVAKYRNGSTGIVPLEFYGHLYRFVNRKTQIETYATEIGTPEQTTFGMLEFPTALPNETQFWANNRTQHDNETKF